MKKWILMASMMLGALLPGANAEDVQLFQASKAGEEAWVWGSARAKRKDNKLVVSLHSTETGAGDTFVANRFPYFPDGKVELSVSEVLRGDYTLQVLGFRKNVHVETIELVSHKTEPAKKSVLMKNAGLTNAIDEILFKIWVGGAKDAAFTIDDLTYSLPLDGQTVVFDERFQNFDAWENETLAPRVAADGAVIALKPDTTFGSILLRQRFPKQTGLRVLWNITRIDNGDATLQFIGFDKDGKYVKSMDGAKNVRGGWHAMPVPMPDWPTEVESFQIKLWVGGQSTATARFGRLLLVKPAQ